MAVTFRAGARISAEFMRDADVGKVGGRVHLALSGREVVSTLLDCGLQSIRQALNHLAKLGLPSIVGSFTSRL